MKTALDDLNAACSANERDYSRDADIAPLLASETPEGMLTAARLIRRRENSAFLKLPLETIQPEPGCREIDRIPDLVLKNKGLQNAIDCLEQAKGEPVLFKLSGPFSAFLSAAGTNATFRCLQKNGSELKHALEQIADGLAEYAAFAAEKGARIISVAEPCAMAEVLGEKTYREFAAATLVRLLKQMMPHMAGSVVHLCPRSSVLLEEFGYITSQEMAVPHANYADALLQLPGGTGLLVGHRCVNGEQAAVDALILLELG